MYGKAKDLNLGKTEANIKFFERLLELMVEIREENDEIMGHVANSSKIAGDKLRARNLDIDRLLIQKREAGIV